MPFVSKIISYNFANLTDFHQFYQAEFHDFLLLFLAWAWPSPKAIVVTPKINSCQNHLRKCEVQLATTLQKRSVKITMYLDLDITIKLKFTTNFDRCAISNVLNCLTKNLEP